MGIKLCIYVSTGYVFQILKVWRTEKLRNLVASIACGSLYLSHKTEWGKYKTQGKKDAKGLFYFFSIMPFKTYTPFSQGPHFLHGLKL